MAAMNRGQPQPRLYQEKIAYQWIPRPMGLFSGATARDETGAAPTPSPFALSTLAAGLRWDGGSERPNPAQDLLEARVVL
jgi:hypothetical protein